MAELEVGARSEHLLVEDLRRTQIVQYAGASGDFNPLHTDERYAVEVGGFPSVFAHGMLTAGLTARILDELVGYAAVRSFGGRFVAQVRPGDTLWGTATVSARTEADDWTLATIDLITRNQDGAVVFTGTAEVVVPT